MIFCHFFVYKTALFLFLFLEGKTFIKTKLFTKHHARTTNKSTLRVIETFIRISDGKTLKNNP